MAPHRKGKQKAGNCSSCYSAFAQLFANRMAAHLHIAEGYVSRAFCIQPNEFYRETRGRRQVVEARQLVMYLAHVELGYPLKDIGHRYHCHRSTAAHACRVTENRREDPEFDDLVCQLEAIISLRNDPLFIAV